MSDSPERRAQRDMSRVRPSWSDAMSALDPETVAALVRRVAIVARGYRRADEVESLAAVTVAGFYSGNVDRAAVAACRAADHAVSQAYWGVDSLDQWAEDAPDMLESIAATSSRPTGLPFGWCPRPDAAYATTDADVIAACIASVTDDDLRRVLQDAARAYVAHGDRRCRVCESASGKGRRVALAGILAHTRGVGATDSQYHALRRLTLAAVRAVDVAAVRAEHYYPHAEGGRAASVSVAREDVLTGDERVTDPVRVTRRDGSSYVTSHARLQERAPERAPEERRADRIAEAIAGAPSRAVRRQERTRGNGGTGAFGSQVPARLS